MKLEVLLKIQKIFGLIYQDRKNKYIKDKNIVG
jgi:hypothetical protein